jgi:hypothetical protein
MFKSIRSIVSKWHGAKLNPNVGVLLYHLLVTSAIAYSTQEIQRMSIQPHLRNFSMDTMSSAKQQASANFLAPKNELPVASSSDYR